MLLLHQVHHNCFFNFVGFAHTPTTTPLLSVFWKTSSTVDIINVTWNEWPRCSHACLTNTTNAKQAWSLSPTLKFSWSDFNFFLKKLVVVHLSKVNYLQTSNRVASKNLIWFFRVFQGLFQGCFPDFSGVFW